MQKLIAGAALAATFSLTLAPATANAPVAQGQPVAQAQLTGTAAMAAAVPVRIDGFARDNGPEITPGQSRADFAEWLARSPASRDALAEFQRHLDSNGVGDVVPLWQLVRTSSSFRECGAAGFEVAPRDKWANIVKTLQFVKRDVVPAVGPVQPVSGYRNPELNRCSNGAPASAHRNFFALDLVPVSADVSRGELIRGVCAAHSREGRGYETGLGFYSGVRFHVDSNGFRRWGANGRGASSPCVTGA